MGIAFSPDLCAGGGQCRQAGEDDVEEDGPVHEHVELRRHRPNCWSPVHSHKSMGARAGDLGGTLVISEFTGAWQELQRVRVGRRPDDGG